ncbi:DUF1553 domain-containing protein, partial [bacterium]|nr:DUF1553 domain-containing protein [bacterium]
MTSCSQLAWGREQAIRLLWRFPSRRLEAEAIRDSMLAVSGRLNLVMGGRGFDLFRSRGGLSGFPPIEQFGPEGRRRMIYAHKIRMEKESVFGAFDCPDAGQTLDRRRRSTTPIQALNLFNSPFTIDEAEAFAARVTQEVAGAGADDEHVDEQIGLEETHGRGCGGDIVKGRNAAKESIFDIRKVLDSDLLFLVGGLGNGTATGGFTNDQIA